MKNLNATAALRLTPPASTDADLVRRIVDGDPQAFEQLMRLHNRRLFRTARAILRDDAEAEDALQDAYLRAYRVIGDFRGEAKLSTWLARIVVNEALARRRKIARRAAIVPIADAALEDDHFQVTASMSADMPHDQAERDEIRGVVEQKIDQLPQKFRSVFVLRAIEDLSVEETASMLTLPEATVRSRFFRARRLLRNALSREVDLAIDNAFAFAGERCDRIVARVLAKLF